MTAVVVTWDSQDDVAACCAALLAQDHPALEVVVVDNGSRDGTRAVLDELVTAAADGPVPLRVLPQARNLGFCAAANLGIAASDAEAVLLVNPDAVLAPDHVRLLAAALADDEGLGSVQGTLLRSGLPGALVDSTGHVALRPRLFRNRGEGAPAVDGDGRVVDVDGVTGAAALHRRAMLDDVAVPGPGGPEWLDETLFAFYDDVDLDWRARLRGWRAGHVPGAHGVHARGGAARRRSPLVEELNAANRLLVVAKLDDPAALARHAPAVLATTALQVLWLLLTSPRAALRVPRRLAAGLGPTRRRRAHARATAVRSSAAVSAGFAPLDVRRWVGGWWRRVSGG